MLRNAPEEIKTHVRYCKITFNLSEKTYTTVFVWAPTKTSVKSQIWPTGPSLGSLSLNTKHWTAKPDTQKLAPLSTSDHDGGYWPGCVRLTVDDWQDSWLWVQRQTFQTEWNYQLLSYLNDNQLPRQRHAANLNFPIKSTPYTHTYTHTRTHNTWYRELHIQWIRADTNNSIKVSSDSSRPPRSTVAICSLSAASHRI